MVFHMACHNQTDGLTEESNDQLYPLYKLKLGLSTGSHGISCARSAGINNIVLERAIELKSSMRSNQKISALHSVKLKTLCENATRATIKRLLLTNWNEASLESLEVLIHNL